MLVRVEAAMLGLCSAHDHLPPLSCQGLSLKTAGANPKPTTAETPNLQGLTKTLRTLKVWLCRSLVEKQNFTTC